MINPLTVVGLVIAGIGLLSGGKKEENNKDDKKDPLTPSKNDANNKKADKQDD